MNPIWAIEVRNRMVRATQFVCPRCGMDRTGAELEPQRWFTLLKTPLVPLATLDRVVECDVCMHQCDIGVLEIPTADLLAAYIDDGLRHAVTSVVRAGGTPSDETRAAAVEAVRANGHDYDLERFDADLVGLDDIATAERLHRLIDELTPHGKQSFLHRMAAVGQVDSALTPAQRKALVDIGVALGMSAPHINGVIAVATAEYQNA